MSIQSEVTPSLRTATSISITISLSAFRFPTLHPIDRFCSLLGLR